MNRLAIALSVALFLSAACAGAQEPRPPTDRGDGRESLGQTPATPEMWFYQQELRRHEDPRVAVRQKAEFRRNQRQRRIAAMKWFGLSNSRPVANPTPVTSSYSPGWTSNTYWPYQWSGQGRTAAFHARYSGSGAMYGLW